MIEKKRIEAKKKNFLLLEIKKHNFRRNRFFFITAAAIVLLSTIFILAIYWQNTPAEFRYGPADIVYGEKIFAIHEMGKKDNSPGYIDSSIVFNQRPILSLSEKYYDFGEVVANQVLTRTFVIANTGKSNLVVYHAYTTCSCTTADFTAVEIPPGKVVLMTLQFNPEFHNMRNTTVRQGVILETNDPLHPSQEIWIQVKVR